MIHSPVFAYLFPPPGQSGSSSILLTVWYVVGLGAIFYFLLIRPQRQQQKQHEQMLKAVKRGDEIVTAGGIVGRVVHVKDDRLTIESGESRLVVERDRVAKVLTQQAAAEPAAKQPAK